MSPLVKNRIISNFGCGTDTQEIRLCTTHFFSRSHCLPQDSDIKFLHIYQKSLVIHYDAIDFLFQLPKAKYLLINIR